MIAPLHRACKNCEFWDEVYGVSICRRYAPKPLLSRVIMDENGEADDASSDIMWPSTTGDDWCGEFSPLRKETEKE